MELFRGRKATSGNRVAGIGPWLAIAAVSLLLQACDQPTGPATDEVPGRETSASAEPTGVTRLTTGPAPVAAPVPESTGRMTISTGAATENLVETAPGLYRLSTEPAPLSSPLSGRDPQSAEAVREATISTPGTDLSLLTGQGTIGVQSVGSADIEVTKTSSVDEAKVDENFNYTLTVRNNGPDAATTVTMQDVLPASLSFVGFISLTGPTGTACVFTSGTVNCATATLLSGEQFVLTMTVKGTAPGTVTNTASGGSAVSDPATGNNSATAVTEILALEADIEVTKTSSVDEAKVDENFNYTLTVRNNGPDAATTVTMQDVLPASLSFVGFISLTGPTGTACVFTSGTVNCATATLLSGEQFVLTMTVKGTAPGTVTNTASGGSAVSDPATGNNSATAVTEILALEADIEVTKTSSAPQVIIGQNFVYTMTVRNNGPDAATAVTMQDVLPASVAFVSFNSLTGPAGTICVFNSGTVNCTAATLLAGEQFVLTMTVKATVPGTVTNTASGESAVDDPVPGNNEASVDVLLIGEGCGIGFWKNWPSVWTTTGYAPSQTIGSVFPNSGRAGHTLMQALSLMGGNGVQGAKDILLRAAVAALLNAAHPDVEYPITAADVLAQVNAALAGGNRKSMLGLAGMLDGYNNLFCPIP